MSKTQEQLSDIDVCRPANTDHAKAMQHATSPKKECYGYEGQQMTSLEAMQQASGREYGHYWKNVKGLDGIDVYKVLELFEIKSHAVGHAIKKLLVAGGRGAKDEKQDINEAIAALKRHLEILEGK